MSEVFCSPTTALDPASMPVRCTTVSWSLERTLLVSNRFMTPKPAAKDGNVSTARCLKIQCGVGAGHGSGPAQPNLVLSTRHNASQHMKMMPHASSQPAKRRGRPRKQQSSVPETTAEVDAHTDSSLKPRGRRGRPPKIRQGDESGREATAGADVLHSSSDSSSTVSPRHRKQTLMSALANTPMHAQTHPSPMQHVHQPVQSMYSAPVAAAATTPLLPVSEQELELAKQQQQQQQQVGPGQLSSAEDRLHSTTSSSSSLQYDSSSASSQGASAHFVAGNDGIQQFGHPQPDTEQYRQAMEHLFRLPDASTSGLSTSSSSVSSSSAADATAGHSAAGHSWTVRPIAEQEPGVSSKGFRVTSTVQGRGFTRQEAPGDQQQQQQDRSKSSPTSSKSSSKSSVDAEEAISVESDQHQHHHHHYDHLHSLNPPEPSPLEPPVHPELQDDVELQGEQLKEHRQLLQQLQLVRVHTLLLLHGCNVLYTADHPSGWLCAHASTIIYLKQHDHWEVPSCTGCGLVCCPGSMHSIDSINTASCNTQGM